MKFAKAVDNRINLEDPTRIVFSSVPSVIYQNIPPSQPSLNPVITIPVPAGLGLSRALNFQSQITFTITGTNLNNFQTEQCLSLRAFPINQCLTSLNIQLGTQSVSITPNLYTSAFLQYNNDTFIQRQNQSGTASAVDTTTSYNPLVGTVASPFANGLDENNSGYSNTCRTKQIVSITPNASSAATQLLVVVNVVEALIASPFTYQGVADPEKAIFNLNNVIITMSFNYLQRMLSYSIPSGSTVSNVSAVFNQQAILCEFIAPFENSLANRTYPTSYNYTYIQSTDTTVASLGVGASVAISTNTQQLSIIPDYFLIYALPSVADLTGVSPSLPDFFFPITAINIQIGQRSNVLGTANQYQLWTISKKNGSNVDWPRWSGQPILDSTCSTTGTANRGIYGGGVLILSTAQDLNLPSSSSVGMTESQNFQANITIQNNTGVAFNNVVIRVVALTSGYMETAGQGNINLVVGGITPMMLENAPIISETTVRSAELNKGYTGGKITWDQFKKGFSSVMKPLGAITKTLAPFTGEYAPALMAAGETASILGNATGSGLMKRHQMRGMMRHY